MASTFNYIKDGGPLKEEVFTFSITSQEGRTAIACTGYQLNTRKTLKSKWATESAWQYTDKDSLKNKPLVPREALQAAITSTNQV